jgi:17beta-estradiol 17-dehydrogenase / very-long-chain 3-oxoacyl-CoA reductase
MPQARPEPRPPFDAIDTFTYDELKQNAFGNAIFPLLLTRALYPQLVRNQPALIVNLGSFAVTGSPLFPSYGPAKAFIMASAAELRLENMIEGRDIEILGIDVLRFTGSDTTKVKPSLLIPGAATYAKAVVRSIGCGYPHVVPYLPHEIVNLLDP